MAAPTTGPSVPPAPKARTHEQENVETRAQVHKPTEGERSMQPAIGVTPAPNYMRPCLGLDVHKGSITATQMGPGGVVLKTWTFPTTRATVKTLAQEVKDTMPIVLEASTSGKAVAIVLKGEGCELHMAAPNKIPKSDVKTDDRDSIHLPHLYQSGSLHECYIPPLDIEHLRLLVRNRKDLAAKVGLVKNQIHALVTRNILDEEMKKVSDWFGVGGLLKLVRLPFPPEERAHLARYLEQLELLANQEESMQTKLATVAVGRKDVQLLMTIPGVGYYTAVGMVAEIGDIRRFAKKEKLASYAGLVSKADNSGGTVSDHRPVKKGNMILKSFLCTAVIGMMKSGQKTAVTAFYQKKAQSRPAQKALVAAARKLSGEVWKILTFEVPYKEEDADLTQRKEKKMQKQAEETAPEVTLRQLETLADRLSGKAEVLQRLQAEVGQDDGEVKDAG